MENRLERLTDGEVDASAARPPPKDRDKAIGSIAGEVLVATTGGLESSGLPLTFKTQNTTLAAARPAKKKVAVRGHPTLTMFVCIAGL